MDQVDTLPYKTFQRLLKKYPVKTIVVREGDMSLQGMHLVFKDHRDYVKYKFSQLGVEVTRWSHDYQSLDGKDPKLGLVYLANDSVITPGLEVHALIGHNAKYMDTATPEKIDGI